MPILGIIASQLSLGNPSYDSIATYDLASAQSSVTFDLTGISGYKHLQLRVSLRATGSGTQSAAAMRFNSDSGTNYTRHELAGGGSGSATAYGNGSNTWAGYFATPSTTTGSYNNNVTGVGVADILDYTNTSKYKTMRLLGGQETNNNYGYLGLFSGVWLNTSAITSLTVFSVDGTSLAQYSHLALYGIKG